MGRVSSEVAWVVIRPGRAAGAAERPRRSAREILSPLTARFSRFDKLSKLFVGEIYPTNFRAWITVVEKSYSRPGCFGKM